MSDRLLQPGHVGPEDGCGGPQRAGEDEISCSGTADGPVSPHMAAAGVSLVYLPLRWRSPGWGERKLERVSVNLFQPASGFLYWQTVLRVWDCLFYEGSKVLFRVALTLIMHHQPEILRARSLPDLCQCFRQITSGAFSLDCHSFMQVGGISKFIKNLLK